MANATIQALIEFTTYRIEVIRKVREEIKAGKEITVPRQMEANFGNIAQCHGDPLAEKLDLDVFKSGDDKADPILWEIAEKIYNLSKTCQKMRFEEKIERRAALADEIETMLARIAD